MKLFCYDTLSFVECQEGISLERWTTLPPAAHRRLCSWKTWMKQQHLTQDKIQLPRQWDWPRLWHKIHGNTVVSFSKCHVHSWNSTSLPFMCLSAFFSLLFLNIGALLFQRKSHILSQCYASQFIRFGFLKFGFQFIVLKQYIKSYIYKYIYFILHI